MPTVILNDDGEPTHTIFCHGGTADIALIIIGGSGYTYQWHNSSGTLISTDRDLTPVPAGTYTITLFKDGNSSSWNFTLTEPSALNITLEASEFAGGYNISQAGGNDGWINCNVYGGVPSYYYQWSNSTYGESIGELTAGTYSVTVTDENGCTATSSTTMNAPVNPLHIVSITSPLYNGFNISCNGGSDGAIDLTVNGGVPPYSYNWGSGVYTQDRDSLPAGLYTVIVDDNIPGGQDTAHITLTQPAALALELNSQKFPNGFNTSCYNCNDGEITTSVSGGTLPYTYLWNNGKTTTYLDSLGKGTDTVTVTDNNGCKISQLYEVTSVFEGWKIGGNNDIDTSKQFMGTKDNKDIIFKTNNTKRMSVKANGTIEMNSPLKISHSLDTTSNYRVVFAHDDGTLDFVGGETNTARPCQPYPVYPWFNMVNTATCEQYNPNDIFLGSNFRYVGIGTNTPTVKLDVSGEIRSSNLSGTSGFNIIHVDNTGILKKLLPPTPNPNLNFLNGDGTWGVLPLGSYAWNFNGTDIINSESNIKIGIGVQTPQAKLDVNGDFRAFQIGSNSITCESNNSSSALFWSKNSSFGYGFGVNGNGTGSIFGNYNAPVTLMTFTNDGAVGINFDPSIITNRNTNYKLYVQGSIAATELKITAVASFPDYVFSRDYKLKSLKEVHQFIQTHRHLPGFKTAEEYKNGGGFEIGKIQQQLLEKVEELTLYIIEQQNQIERLQEDFKHLKVIEK